MTRGDGDSEPGRLERVLLVGDSLVEQAYPTFEAVFADAGITVGYAGGPGTGPLSPQNSWADQTRQWVTRFDPQVVVIEACCNYSTPGLVADGADLYRTADGTVVEPGTTEAVYQAWNTETRRLVRIARRSGAQVVTVTSPDSRTGGFYGPLDAHVDRLNRLYRDLPADGNVDWWAALSDPDGSYRPDLRVADGLHLTGEGDTLIATATLHTARQTHRRGPHRR